jgi:circadian clock protein KaiC
MDERVKSGVSGYDNLLNGGFIRNSINLISGCSGSGKTLYTLSYLCAGARDGEKGVYITLEEMTDHIIRDALRVGMDLKEFDDDIFMMYDMSSLRVNALNTMDEVEKEESPLRLDNLLEFIRINYSDTQRIGIDSIVPMAIAYSDDRIFRAELFRFMMGLKKMGITVLFTTELPYSSNDTSRFGMEDFIADCVTILRMREDWGRQIKIHKMRGSDHYKNFVDYDISAAGLKVLYK